MGSERPKKGHRVVHLVTPVSLVIILDIAITTVISDIGPGSVILHGDGGTSIDRARVLDEHEHDFEHLNTNTT